MPKIVTKLPDSVFFWTSAPVPWSAAVHVYFLQLRLALTPVCGTDSRPWVGESAAVHIRLQQHSCGAGSHGIEPFFSDFIV